MNTTRLVTLAVLSLLMAACTQSVVKAVPPPPLLPQDFNALVDLRRAGLAGDHSQIPALRKALHVPHDTFIITSLRALAQMGASEALPDIDSLLASRPADYVWRYAQEARVYLRAEAAAQDAPTPAARQTAALTYLLVHPPPASTAAKNAPFTGSSRHTDYLGNLADIAYRGPLPAAALPAALKSVDFSQDSGAQLKLTLAAMPLAARLPWLIDTLAQQSSSSTLMVQLAADFGPPAAALAAARLQAMLTHRKEYQYGGFANLFDILCAVGDPKMASAVAPFLHDGDVYVANTAQIDYGRTMSGERVQYAAGY